MKTPRKMSEIMKRMAESVLLDPGNESGEAFQAALLLSHIAWNRSLGNDWGTRQYRSILSEMEMENPELWGELADTDAEALICSLMEFKNMHYPEDRRNLVVCGMREGNVHTEWTDPEDRIDPLEIMRGVIVHILMGNAEEAVAAYATATKMDVEEAREKVAAIETIVRDYEATVLDAEGAESVAASIIDGIKANRSEAAYNLIDLPPEQVIPERTFALSDIMNEFETYRGYFPREALAAAIADPELVTPALLQSIRYATDEAEHIAAERPDYMAHIYAMYLMAQFRETRAYPLVAAFASLPEKLLYDIAGDFVTESLGQVFASVCGGDQRLIRELLEDEKIDEFVRGAAVHALVCLVVAGQAEREDVLAYFGELLRSDFAREPSYVLDDLILYAAHLCPTGIIDDIRAAYESGVADEGYILLEEVEERLRTGPEAALDALSKDRSYALINDTLEDMKWWTCIREDGAFDEEVDEEFEEFDEDFDTTDFRPLPPPPHIERIPQAEPIRRESPKVGRNDPCPCGSGRKYKKCCGQ